MPFSDSFQKENSPQSHNSALLQAWETYRRSGAETDRADFYEELCTKARFLLLTTTPITTSNEKQLLTLTEDTPVNFALIQSEEKEIFFPLFTDWQQIAKWTSAPSNQAYSLDFDDLATLMAGATKVTGGVLNPFDQNILLPRQLVARLKEQKEIRSAGHTQINLLQDSQIQLAAVTAEAEPLKASLRDFFAHHPEVKRAWLTMMKREGEVSYLLVLDFTGEKEQLFPMIAQSVSKQLAGYYLDMAPYTATGFPGEALKDTTPFYEN